MRVKLMNDWFCPGGYRIRKQSRNIITIPDAYFSELPKSATVVEGPDPKNPAEEPVMDHSDNAKAKLFGNDAAGARATAENNILANQANKEESDRLAAERAAFHAEREAFELHKLEQAKAEAEYQADAEEDKKEDDGVDEPSSEADDETDDEPDADETEGAGEPSAGETEGADEATVNRAKKRSRRKAA